MPFLRVWLEHFKGKTAKPVKIQNFNKMIMLKVFFSIKTKCNDLCLFINTDIS